MAPPPSGRPRAVGLGDGGSPDANGDDASSDDDGGMVLRDANVASLPPFPPYGSWAPMGNATFFIGNSFTDHNHMPFAYQEMNEALGVMPFRMEAYTIGGYTFAQDVMDMSNDTTGISQFLVMDALRIVLDVVVMQEQSDTPASAPAIRSTTHRSTPRPPSLRPRATTGSSST